MQSNQIPQRLPIPFANSGAKTIIPVASQVGVTPGAASLTDGFPPLTRTPLAAGGIPPSGQDMNGILYMLSASSRWINAGGGFPFDQAFCTLIGGYPKGALIPRADQDGFWVNQVENNLNAPEVEDSGWAVAAIRAAEQDEVEAGTRNDVAVTPKTLRLGVSWLANINGYLSLPRWLGGFTIQWGMVTSTGNGQTVYTSFPTEFPNVCYVVTGSYVRPVPPPTMDSEAYKFAFSVENKGTLIGTFGGPVGAQYFYIAVGR